MRNGPWKLELVATVIITLAFAPSSPPPPPPKTLATRSPLPKTQNASYARRPSNRAAAAEKEPSPTTLRKSAAMEKARKLLRVKSPWPSARSAVAHATPIGYALASASDTGSAVAAAPVRASVASPGGTGSVNSGGGGSEDVRVNTPVLAAALTNGERVLPAASDPRSQKYPPTSAPRSNAVNLRTM